MSQEQRRIYLIKQLQMEQSSENIEPIPESEEKQYLLLRKLMNIRPPKSISDDFLFIQNNFLQEELSQKESTALHHLNEVEPDIYLWQGDITTLEVDGIVNAANNDMTGCYIPNHNCIDNIIHTNAGIQLRLACQEIIDKQGRKEPVGKAKITKAYNLPSDYVLHTIGPFIRHKVSPMQRDLLKSSYMETLKLADEKGLKSLAFPCISTGVFNFPNDQAAEIAVETVQTYKKETGSNISVIFNVYKDLDYDLYKQLFN